LVFLPSLLIKAKYILPSFKIYIASMQYFLMEPWGVALLKLKKIIISNLIVIINKMTTLKIATLKLIN